MFNRQNTKLLICMTLYQTEQSTEHNKWSNYYCHVIILYITIILEKTYIEKHNLYTNITTIDFEKVSIE